MTRVASGDFIQVAVTEVDVCGDVSCHANVVAGSQNDSTFEPEAEHAPLGLLFTNDTLIFDVQANKILDAKPSFINAL